MSAPKPRVFLPFVMTLVLSVLKKGPLNATVAIMLFTFLIQTRLQAGRLATGPLVLLPVLVTLNPVLVSAVTLQLWWTAPIEMPLHLAETSAPQNTQFTLTALPTSAGLSLMWPCVQITKFESLSLAVQTPFPFPLPRLLVGMTQRFPNLLIYRPRSLASQTEQLLLQVAFEFPRSTRWLTKPRAVGAAPTAIVAAVGFAALLLGKAKAKIGLLLVLTMFLPMGLKPRQKIALCLAPFVVIGPLARHPPSPTLQMPHPRGASALPLQSATATRTRVELKTGWQLKQFLPIPQMPRHRARNFVAWSLNALSSTEFTQLQETPDVPSELSRNRCALMHPVVLSPFVSAWVLSAAQFIPTRRPLGMRPEFSALLIPA